MNQENQFSISRFKNRNGVFSNRVDGRLHRVRFRRNFNTKEAAAAERTSYASKQIREIDFLRGEVADAFQRNLVSETKYSVCCWA